MITWNVRYWAFIGYPLSVEQVTVSVRIVEHRTHIRLGQIDKSAIAQHCWALGHEVWFDKIMVLYR